MAHDLKDDYEAAIGEIVERMEADVEKVADHIYKTLIVPACKRHRLVFKTGNGTFTFFGTGKHKNLQIGSVDDCVLEGYEDLMPIFDILNIEITRDGYLGYYVPDYPAK